MSEWVSELVWVGGWVSVVQRQLINLQLYPGIFQRYNVDDVRFVLDQHA